MRIVAGKFGSHLGYIYRRNRRKNNALLALVITVALLWGTFSFLRRVYMPIAATLAEAKARSVATLVINDTVAQYMSDGAFDFSSMYTVEKTGGGDIAAITADTVKINLLKSTLSKEIQNKLDAIDTRQIGIPLGSMLGSEFTAGRGPRLPIKLLVAGLIAVDFGNTFTSAGINQTKHTVTLRVAMDVSAILPLGRAPTRVSTEIPVSDTVIVGKVPQTYADIQF